jgi:hypothetical protein
MSTVPNLGPVKEADAKGTEVFDAVRQDVLHKIWELHKADAIHHLNEIRKLDHLRFYKAISYREEEVPYGINYFGKVLLNDKGKCVHVRVFRPEENAGPIKFHSVHTRPSDQGGAVFTPDDEIAY